VEGGEGRGEGESVWSKEGDQVREDF
jgi:hypothetical protein